MCRKIIAIALFLVLLFEILPMEAIAEAGNIEKYLLPEDVLERYVEFYGWKDEKTKRWHEGMNSLPEGASAEFSWSFVDSLVNKDMANLMDFFQQINITLEDVDQSNSTPSENWLEEYRIYYEEALSLVDDLTYFADTLSADMSYISANAEIVWNEEYSPRTRRYTSMRICEAVDRIDENLTAIQNASEGWRMMIDQMNYLMANANGDSPVDPFTETLRSLMQTKDRDLRIFKAPINVANENGKALTLLNRLEGRNELPHADIVIVNNEKFAIGTVGADSKPLEGASVTVYDLYGNGKTAKTEASGYASFSAFDFAGWQDNEAELDVEVTVDGYQKLHYSNMMQKKGQTTNVFLQKDDGKPYIYGASFNGEDIFNEEQIFYFSRKSTDTLDLAVDIVSGSACTVKMDCTLLGKKHETYVQEVGKGDRRVVFRDQWLCKLQPDTPVTITVTDKDGNSNECKLKLTVWRAVLEEPLDDQGKFMNIPWSYGGLGCLLPDSIVKPIGGSRIDLSLPLDKYIPKVFIAPNGAAWIAIGANVTDPFTTDDITGEKHKGIANKSKKKIDAAVKAVEKSGWLAQQMAKAGAIWEGASPKNKKLLASVDFDISLFAVLQGKYTKLTGYEGEDTTGNLELDGFMGATFSVRAEVTAQLSIFYCGVNFAASFSNAFGVSVNMHTTWPKGKSLPDVDGIDLNPAATGLTINVRFEVGACVGIGVRGIIGVSINGFAYFNVRFNMTSDPSMQVSVGGGVYALAEILFIKWRIDIWKAPEGIIYDSRKAAYNSAPALMTRNATLNMGNDTKVFESKPTETHLEPQDVTRLGDSLKMYGSHVEIVELDGMLFALYLDKMPYDSSWGEGPILCWKNLSNGKSGNMFDFYHFKDEVLGQLKYRKKCVYDFCVSGIVSNTAGSNADRYAAIGILTSSGLEKRTRAVNGETVTEYVPCNKIGGNIWDDIGVYMGLIRVKEDGTLTGDSLSGYQTFSRIGYPVTRPSRYPKNPTLYACENPREAGLFNLEMLTGQYDNETETMIYSFAHGVEEEWQAWRKERAQYNVFHQRTYNWLIPYEIKNQNAYSRAGGGGVFYWYNANDENKGVSNWYELTRIKDQELPTEDSRLMYYENDQEYDNNTARDLSRGRACILDEGTISSFQITHEPYRLEESEQLIFDCFQTDRAFYAVKQDDGYHLRGALVTHNKKSYENMIRATRIEGTDYGVTLPSATFNVAAMNGSTLIYWLESCSAPEGKTGAYYRVCGTFYDAKKDIMTDKIILAEINAGDKIPMNLQMTSKGRAYYVLCQKDEQESTTDSNYIAEVYTFNCSSTVDMALVDARPVDRVATAGKYLDTIVTVKNQGNTPIAGFDLEVLEGSENADPFEIIHVDCLNPENNRIELMTNTLTNYTSGDKAVWRVDGVEDPLNANNWIVKRRVILGDDERSESLSRTKLLMPTDQICYQVAMQVPARWEGDKKLFYRVSAINACINWSDTVHDERENADDSMVPVVRCVRQSDGSVLVEMPNRLMANDEDRTDCWPLDTQDMKVYFDGIALDTETENLWIDGRRIEINGEDTISLTIGNEAEWNGMRNNAALYVILDGDENTRRRVADLDQIIGGQGLYTGDVLNMTMPLELLTGGCDPETLTLEITGKREEMIFSDSRWELKLREPRLVIVKQPESQTIMEENTVVLSVEAEGGVQPYRFQWQQQNSGSSEWKDIPETNSAELALVKMSLEADGNAYRCVVTDENGDSVTSIAAIVHVINIPVIPKTGDPYDPRAVLLLLLMSGTAVVFLSICGKRRFGHANK